MQSLNTRFSALDLANPSQSGALADPDHDEQPNLLEYAFNRNTQKADTSSAVTATFPTISGTRYVDLSFSKNRFATDIATTCESSTDLQTWNPTASEIVSSTVTDFETEQVTLRVPAAITTLFVRLKVVR